MARSLSLAAYMALARRATGKDYTPKTPRPSGPLLWLHAPTLARFYALRQVIYRMQHQNRRLVILLTTPPDIGLSDLVPSGVIHEVVPDESVNDIKMFLDHWQPNICLWSGGYLRPALIEGAAARSVPLYLVEAEDAGFDEARWRWLPDLARLILRRFTTVFTLTEVATTKLQRLGVAPKNIVTLGALQDAAVALPCRESDREEMARLLVGRPTWVASMVHEEEIEILQAAHRLALRGGHRLLLILIPADPNKGDEIRKRLEALEWRVAQWSCGEYPVETTHILIGDTADELGLWYRLSAISFMGSSLVAGYGGRNPFEPAALGSAVLYGPHISRYLPAYSRLAAAGGARIVKDAETLASAITLLTAPDQAAMMASAAWDVATSGAEQTDKIVTLLLDTLDQLETA